MYPTRRLRWRGPQDRPDEIKLDTVKMGEGGKEGEIPHLSQSRFP